MIFYCKLKKQEIAKGKAKAYCLNKMNCWALKIFRTKFELNKFKNKNL